MENDFYKKIFSKNLRRYMELNKKTQIDLVNDLGFNKSAVSTWYIGTRLPRMDKVETLANYFGITRSDLLEENLEEFPDSSCCLTDDTRKIAEFLSRNPEYKVLFDTCLKVKKEEIDFVNQILKIVSRQH